jgi:hypothetical protein
MKKLAIILFVLPLFIQAQNDQEDALFILNRLRNFDVSESVNIDPELNKEATESAKKLKVDVILGKGLSNVENNEIATLRPKYSSANHYSEAIFAFLILPDDPMYYRRKMVNYNLKAVGFGHAYVDDKILIVFKFKEVED